MKLFERKTISKLREVSKEALFCFGRYEEEKWMKLGIVDECKDKRRWAFVRLNEIKTVLLKGGFYLVINSPFKMMSKYISSLDFLNKKGIIKHRIAFSLRKQFSTIISDAKWKFYFNMVKWPLNDKCEINCIDPAGPQPIVEV